MDTCIYRFQFNSVQWGEIWTPTCPHKRFVYIDSDGQQSVDLYCKYHSNNSPDYIKTDYHKIVEFLNKNETVGPEEYLKHLLYLKKHPLSEDNTTCQKCNREVDQYITCLDFWKNKTTIDIQNNVQLYEKWINKTSSDLLAKDDPDCIRLCTDCAQKCSWCDSWLCNDKYCAKNCVACDKIICRNCAQYCKHCDTPRCFNCNKDKKSMSKNDTAQPPQPPQPPVTCKCCGEQEKCEQTCNRKPNGHIKSCCECKENVCWGCSYHCSKCTGAVCTHCRHMCKYYWNINLPRE